MTDTMTLQDKLRSASVRPDGWDVPEMMKDAADRIDSLTNDAEPPATQPKPNVWHIGYNGPRVVTLLWLTDEKDRAVVDFHGTTELVKASETFPTEEAAYIAAWLAETEQVQKAMIKATEYKKRADQLRVKKGE